jgi:hypothetical protein
MRTIHLLEPFTDIVVTECELSVPLEPLHHTNSSFNYRNPAPTMVMPAQTRNPDQATVANVPKIMTSKGHMDFLLALSAPQLHRCILEPVDSTLDRSAEDCDAREGESAAAFKMGHCGGGGPPTTSNASRTFDRDCARRFSQAR